jgi:hypothetical protein
MARRGSGARTEAASPKAMEAPVPVSEAVAASSWSSPPRSTASTRASRTAPRKTLSNADRHASSSVSATVPPGDPPTLINAPSRRPKRSRAAVISWLGAAESALSAMAQAAAPGVASCVRRAAAAAAVLSWGALGSTRAHQRRVPGLRRNQGPGCRRSPCTPCPAIQDPCAHPALMPSPSCSVSVPSEPRRQRKMTTNAYRLVARSEA